MTQHGGRDPGEQGKGAGKKGRKKKGEKEKGGGKGGIQEKEEQGQGDEIKGIRERGIQGKGEQEVFPWSPWEALGLVDAQESSGNCQGPGICREWADPGIWVHCPSPIHDPGRHSHIPRIPESVRLEKIPQDQGRERPFPVILSTGFLGREGIKANPTAAAVKSWEFPHSPEKLRVGLGMPGIPSRAQGAIPTGKDLQFPGCGPKPGTGSCSSPFPEGNGIPSGAGMGRARPTAPPSLQECRSSLVLPRF